MLALPLGPLPHIPRDWGSLKQSSENHALIQKWSLMPSMEENRKSSRLTAMNWRRKRGSITDRGNWKRAWEHTPPSHSMHSSWSPSSSFRLSAMRRVTDGSLKYNDREIAGFVQR